MNIVQMETLSGKVLRKGAGCLEGVLMALSKYLTQTLVRVSRSSVSTPVEYFWGSNRISRNRMVPINSTGLIWSTKYLLVWKKRAIEHKIYFNFRYKFCLKTFPILWRTERDITKMYFGLHVKCPLYISDFNGTWIFLADFRKILTTNLRKIHPMGAEMFRADGQTGIQT
jgi:hypothetical protein